MHELFVCLTVGITGTAHSDILEQTQIADLVSTQLLVEVVRGFDSVRTNAADVVRSA